MSVAVWWRAIRPFSATASVTPVIVGGATAFARGRFDPLLLAVTLVATWAIHMGTNLSNDYYDHVRGVDRPGMIGPSGVIQEGLLSARQVLWGAIAFFALGGVLGLYLAWVVGWPVLALGVLAILAGYAYTGGPIPYGYLGLGDVIVFLAMGLMIVAGTDYVLTRQVHPMAIWAAVPIGFLVTAILVANNVRDLDTDRAAGKRTLATFIGRENSIAEYLLLVFGSFPVVALAVVLGALPATTLLSGLTLPLAISAGRRLSESRDPLTITLTALRPTARLHQWFGLLLALGLVLGRWIR